MKYLNYVLCLALLGSTWSCDDSATSSDEPIPDLSQRSIESDSRIGVGALDGGGGMITNDALLIGPTPDAGGAGECVPGNTRCSAERADFEEYCRNDERWTIRACENDEVCVNGGCLPDPLGCAPGTRICDPATGQPAECRNDEWAVQDACAPGERCEGGECLSEACAYAARTASYLGCDYLAVDLPNTAFIQPDGGTTPDSPLGLVIANTSPTDVVQVNIRTADGQAAELVSSQRINVPNIPDITGRYQPQTIGSRVIDSDGMVVQAGLDSGVNVQIPPGGQGTFLLPRRMGPVTGSSLRPDAFRVTTNSPVVAYQFSPYCCNYSFSNDASLLLPTAALGKKYRYLGIPVHSIRDPFGGVSENGRPMVAVVSPTPNNQVSVRMPGGLIISPDALNQVNQAGDSVNVTMDEQDVLLVMASSQGGTTDLTGSLIESSQPVAVFSAHLCTFYPEALSACDHVQEQLFPMNTWGTSFQLAPPAEAECELGDGGGLLEVRGR